jgi:putative transcriptional regulator
VNICGISQHDAYELKKISEQFSAIPLFIGETVREKRLEDDTVYSRYDVYTVNPKTLEDIVLKKLHPLVEAGPGGYYVRLDGEAIRKRRQEVGLSIGKLAEMVGVSRRTLYGYERGMAKASVSTAYNLEWILGAPLVKPINIFEEKRKKGFFSSAKNAIAKTPVLKALIKKFHQCNIKFLHVKKAPFDFVAKYSRENLTLLGGIALNEEKILQKRVEEIISVSKIVDAQPVLITNDKKLIKQNNEVPFLHEQEILKAKSLEEVIARI